MKIYQEEPDIEKVEHQHEQSTNHEQFVAHPYHHAVDESKETCWISTRGKRRERKKKKERERERKRKLSTNTSSPPIMNILLPIPIIMRLMKVKKHVGFLQEVKEER